jgi:hypothetical protein
MEQNSNTKPDLSNKQVIVIVTLLVLMIAGVILAMTFFSWSRSGNQKVTAVWHSPDAAGYRKGNLFYQHGATRLSAEKWIEYSTINPYVGVSNNTQVMVMRIFNSKPCSVDELRQIIIQNNQVVSLRLLDFSDPTIAVEVKGDNAGNLIEAIVATINERNSLSPPP